MNYIIKDWRKFQHFKDRRPPWIKLHKELIDDVDYHKLSNEAAKYLTLFWLLASEDETKSGLLPDVETMAFRLRLSIPKVNELLSQLSHYIIHDDIKMISSGYQDDEPEKRREEESRDRVEAEANSSPDLFTSKQSDKKETPPTPSLELEFEECWKPYPNKDGKAKAFIAYKKARKNGVTNATILDGIKRYIAYVTEQRAGGFKDLKFKNGSTWFYQECWTSEYTIQAPEQKKLLVV